MHPSVFVMFLLLIGCLQGAECRLPDFTPATQRLQVGEMHAGRTWKPVHADTGIKVGVSLNSTAVDAQKKKKRLGRLPGLCRRLRRRRITVLCNLEKFCRRGRSHANQSGQVCVCPRGSRCSHFFIRSP